MKSNKRLLPIVIIALASVPIAATAQNQTPAREEAATQERIYGSQMMTQQERNEYRSRMRAAQTTEERDRIRAEHHDAMQQRARERGLTLPDAPRQGAGSGMGPGGAMGPASGMGPRGGTGHRGAGR